VALAAAGRSVPPSKLMVAVVPLPRTVGKAGRVTFAVPPILSVTMPELPTPKAVKLVALNVPPVTVNVELRPVAVAAAPPIDRFVTDAVPPV